MKIRGKIRPVCLEIIMVYLLPEIKEHRHDASCYEKFSDDSKTFTLSNIAQDTNIYVT